MYPQHGETAAVLLERADRAMYLAKSSGGGVREATAM
jgi:GGDEF domain-containing protein